MQTDMIKFKLPDGMEPKVVIVPTVDKNNLVLTGDSFSVSRELTNIRIAFFGESIALSNARLEAKDIAQKENAYIFLQMEPIAHIQLHPLLVLDLIKNLVKTLREAPESVLGRPSQQTIDEIKKEAELFIASLEGKVDHDKSENIN